MIYSNSRYANEPVTVVTDHRGTHQSISVQTPGDRVFNYTSHIVSEGETPDGLAFAIYGDGRLWWLIADANPEILDWSHLAPGTVLRIPHV